MLTNPSADIAMQRMQHHTGKHPKHGRHKHRSSRRQYAGQRRGRADRRQQWRMAPYSGIRYTATVRTGKKIKTGEAIFRISIGDAENREYDWLEFAILQKDNLLYRK